MRFFERTSLERADDKKSFLKPIDGLPKLDLTRPTIIHLPGFMTVDGRQFDQLEMNTRIIETHLGGADLYEHDSKPQFFAMSYSPNNLSALQKSEQSKLVTALSLRSKQSLQNTRSIQTSAYRKDPNYTSRDARQFVHDILIPAISNHEGIQDAETVARRLSHLTFCSNSYGSIFAHEVENELKKTFMESNCFTAQEVSALLSCVVNIAAPNVSRTATPRSFTNILFEGREDPYRKFVQDTTELTRKGEIRESLTKILRRKTPLNQKSRAKIYLDEPEEDFTIKTLRSNCVEVAFNPPTEAHIPQREFIFAGQPNSKDRKIHDIDHHDPRLYMIPSDFPIKQGKPAPTIGKLYGRVVRNAVMRTERNTHLDYTSDAMSFITRPSEKMNASQAGDTALGKEIGIIAPTATVTDITAYRTIHREKNDPIITR